MPAVELSLERSTARVPNDGCYHVVFKGELRGSFRTKAQALALYRALLAESGYEPPALQAPIDASQETVERYMDELEAYWLDSHSHRRRGGKTMYRS